MKKSVIGFVFAVISGAAAAAIGISHLKNKVIAQKAEKVDKFKGYYNLLNQWLMLKNEGKNLGQYFSEHGYKEIAIYGLGELGNRLYEELKNTEVIVKYGIDKNAENTYTELDVYSLEEDYKEVDVVVVTAVFAFDQIKEELIHKVKCPVISLEDILYEL